MKSNVNYNPKYDHLMIEPEFRVEDDILTYFDFDQIEPEYEKDQIDFQEMQNSSPLEVKVFNELFLDKEIEYLEVLDLDISYPLYV